MIKAAAILHNGIIYKGKRHREIIEQNKQANLKEGQEGFVTKNGMFVDREQAAKIALSAGQIKRPKKKLISEDLW
jgi:hypothetical protein